MNKHSYLIYEIHRCHESLRDTTKLDPECVGDSCESVDPECAEEEGIDEWLRTKKAMFRLLNS